MLSYQHIYHAGNLADVHKHALLCAALDYMTHKDKPLSYIETHAGRGLYDLGAAEALKTGEAAAGIDLVRARGWFGPDHPYMRALSRVAEVHGAQAYAGSPVLAAETLRDMDSLHFAELHPQEFTALEYAMSPFGAKCAKADGLAHAMAICPPMPRRGMILIDPSYEIKTEYQDLPVFIGKLNRKWNVGVIALWYPILTSGAHKEKVAALRKMSLPDVLDHQVYFPPAREGHGMIGSGMFIVNAPYGLDAEASALSGKFSTLTG